MTGDEHRAKYIEEERRKMLEAKTIKDAKRIRPIDGRHDLEGEAMTSDDHRAKCIEEQAVQILRYDGGFGYDVTIGAYDIGSEQWAREFLASAKNKPMCKCGDCPKCQADEVIAKTTAAFDSLPTAGARVVPIEATEEMLWAARNYFSDGLTAYDAISAAGDLTNAPEKKS